MADCNFQDVSNFSLADRDFHYFGESPDGLATKLA